MIEKIEINDNLKNLFYEHGNYWQTPDAEKQRYYIDLDALYQYMMGLYIIKYKTGNVMLASVDGEVIPNSKAIKYIFVQFNTVFYDVINDEIVIMTDDNNPPQPQIKEVLSYFQNRFVSKKDLYQAINQKK